MHQTNNLNDGYLGSGSYLKRSIKKYGIENFDRRILFFCKNIEELSKMEKEILSIDFIKNKKDKIYNIQVGGWGGKNINEFLEKRSNSLKGRKGGFEGKKHTEETKKKMSESSSKPKNYNLCWISNFSLQKETLINVIDLDNYIKSGWIKGRKISKIILNIHKMSKHDKYN